MRNAYWRAQKRIARWTLVAVILALVIVAVAEADEIIATEIVAGPEFTAADLNGDGNTEVVATREHYNLWASGVREKIRTEVVVVDFAAGEETVIDQVTGTPTAVLPIIFENHVYVGVERELGVSPVRYEWAWWKQIHDGTWAEHDPPETGCPGIMWGGRCFESEPETKPLRGCPFKGELIEECWANPTVSWLGSAQGATTCRIEVTNASLQYSWSTILDPVIRPAPPSPDCTTGAIDPRWEYLACGTYSLGYIAPLWAPEYSPQHTGCVLPIEGEFTVTTFCDGAQLDQRTRWFSRGGEVCE